MQDFDKKGGKVPRKKLGTGVLVWLFLFAAALFLAQVLSSKRTLKEKLTYTEFINKVESGQISECKFKGRTITGRFKIPDKIPIGSGGKSLVYEEFSLNIPFDDPDLPKFLAENGVSVTAEEEGSNFWSIALNILPWLLIPLLYFVFIRQMQGAQRGIFSFGKSRAQRVTPDKQRVTFEDVAGCDEAKVELNEIIEFLKTPQKFIRLGGRIPRGAMICSVAADIF